jgi:hypothetical protein
MELLQEHSKKFSQSGAPDNVSKLRLRITGFPLRILVAEKSPHTKNNTFLYRVRGTIQALKVESGPLNKTMAEK